MCTTVSIAGKGAMKPYPGTQAVRRALRVLKSFTDERSEWRLAELAEAVGLHRSTTYRALVALESEGLIVRDAAGDAYRLGPELIVLGSRALRMNDLRSVSRPELELLARRVDETVTLEVEVGGEVLILDEVQGPGMLGTHVDIGTRWPLHATSTGKALLAAAADGWQLPPSLPRLTPRTLTTRAALRTDLLEVRRRGYAVAAEELQPGYVAVGAAVRNHEGRAVAAVGVGGPTSRLTPERVPALGGLVLEAADRISARLGAPARESQ
jgi:IclR family transcriptional regulator, acetate operon repressor